MQESWWERPTCILCDWWWAILLGIGLLLAAYFTRQFWLPAAPAPVTSPTRVTSLGTGDVQITLTWASTNDLDLWVTDPAGEKIFYRHANSLSHGELDVDANAGCQHLTSQPVENIFWPAGRAPIGLYLVEVQYYQQCETDAPIDYKVRVLVDGQVNEYTGRVLAQGEQQRVTSFDR